MRVVISYSYTDDKYIVMWVVKMSGIFFGESNDGVVHPRHLGYETRQLDFLNHPEVSLTGLFG